MKVRQNTEWLGNQFLTTTLEVWNEEKKLWDRVPICGADEPKNEIGENYLDL